MAIEKQRRTFISYSRVNKDFALKLAKELRSSGFNIWLDQLDIPTGARWDDELESALEECEIFMVIITPASSASDNVKDEIGYAIDHGKRILPVLLEDADVPFRLRRFQYVDFTSKSYEEGIESAKKLLTNLINEPTTPREEIPVVSQDEETRAKEVRDAKTIAERLAKERAEEERLAQARAEMERKAKQDADHLAVQKAEADRKNVVTTVKDQIVFKKIPVWVWIIGSVFGTILLLTIIYALTDRFSGIAAVITPSLTPTPTSTFTPTLTSTISPTPSITPTPTPTVTPTATPLPMTIIDDFGIKMQLVPAGLFQMGSENGEDDEQPVHTVFLDDYYIDQFEITNEQFAVFLNEQGNQEQGGVTWLDAEDSNVRIHQISGSWEPDDAYETHPVVEVSWYGAAAYCQWRGMRLPTEAEWEKAARGGLDGMAFPWGDEMPSCTLGSVNGGQSLECGGDTIPVGSFAPNGYGLFDMAGNVWEWVADWYDGGYYLNSQENNPAGPEAGTTRVFRGGSWNGDGIYLRVALRYDISPDSTGRNLGFRCAGSP